jgi:hypothetical protein
MTDYENKMRQLKAENLTRKTAKDNDDNSRLIADIYEIVKKWSKDTTNEIYEEKSKKADMERLLLAQQVRKTQEHRIAVGYGIKRKTKK